MLTLLALTWAADNEPTPEPPTIVLDGVVTLPIALLTPAEIANAPPTPIAPASTAATTETGLVPLSRCANNTPPASATKIPRMSIPAHQPMPFAQCGTGPKREYPVVEHVPFANA